MRIVSVCHLGFSFVARFESLLKELSQLALENRTRQLIRQNRRDADSNRRGDFLLRECLEGIDQRQVSIDCRFRDPVAAVRPATVIQHVGQVTVKRENEIHIRLRSPERREQAHGGTTARTEWPSCPNRNRGPSLRRRAASRLPCRSTDSLRGRRPSRMRSG